MNFLKKNLKTIILVVVAVVITGGISVFATYNYVASDIGYTKKDGTETNVASALNELYERELTFVKQTDMMRTDAANTTSTTISLQPGKYLIIGAARTVQWANNMTLTGDSSIKALTTSGFHYWNENDSYGGTANKQYEYGRGNLTIYPFVVELKEAKTLTGTLSTYVREDNYTWWTVNNQLYSVGGFTVYKY